MNIEPHAFENLGGKERQVDPRDLKASATPGTSIPPIFVQPSAFVAPIYYQRQRPACSAHAAAWLSSFLRKSPAPGYSPRFSWVDIKKNGSDTNPSDGANMYDIFKSLRNTGVDSFEPLENDTTLTDAQYADPAVVNDAMRSDAQGRRIASYYFADSPTFAELKQLIYEHHAVVILMQVGASMWSDAKGNVSWNPLDILPLRSPLPVIDGHFVVCHSYTENYIYFANSWSADWGVDGHGYFGADYMPYVLEVGAASLS